MINLSSIQYTKSLGNFINKIRTELLGYSHDTFAQLLRTVPSASYYICGGARKPRETTKKEKKKCQPTDEWTQVTCIRFL